MRKKDITILSLLPTADESQIKLLREGVIIWNKWREEHPEEEIDLSGADLSQTDLIGANFLKADLHGANLQNANLKGANLNLADLRQANVSGANLSETTMFRTYFLQTNLQKANLSHADFSDANLVLANLKEANLQKAYFKRADLYQANFEYADLHNANLSEANLQEATFHGANLTNVNLYNAKCYRTDFSSAILKEAELLNASLVECNLEKAILTNSKIYGLSVWNLKGSPKEQTDMVITPDNETEIRVDDLQVAQFIYLLLNNKNVRNVIDTITSKAVLILGNFSAERKAILEAIYVMLRNSNYLPILFDFSGPKSRDITETISILTHLARFVIADITDAKSIPQELQAVVPNLPSVPVQPILLSSQSEYGMFEHFKRYPWVLPIFYYQDINEVIGSLKEKILIPLEFKVKEILGR